MADPARTRAERLSDTRRRLEQDVDAWVATAGPAGVHLVPLSFLWQDETVVLSTAAASLTGRNAAQSGRLRLGLGPTRDVVLVEGPVELVDAAEIDPGLADAFAAKAGFDPRASSDRYVYLLVRPLRVQAWREENELAGRDLMRAGRWLTP